MAFGPAAEKFKTPLFILIQCRNPPGSGMHRFAAKAFHHSQLDEFLLLYEEVRKAIRRARRDWHSYQSTYEPGATLGGRNRDELERPREELG